MAMISFSTVAGERAFDETRFIIAPPGSALPPDAYGFFEFYCNDPACDCRRVIFQVWRKSTGNKVWATITYGWESPEYYARWGSHVPKPEAEKMSGATLEQISPQTELSQELLEVFRGLLQTDPGYVARLQQHYHETCPSRSKLAPPKPIGELPPKIQRRLRERRRKK